MLARWIEYLRIQSSISKTLSLEQSEIANLQATLSVKQGKALMTFTIVTILFLPLSFLTSFFAMDFEAFQGSACWAKLVVFSSTFVFILLLLLSYVIPKLFSFNRSTDPKAIPIDLGSRTPAQLEQADPFASVRKRDKLVRLLRKYDQGCLL
ncbi:hypothetical protein V2G26_000211 [Clonostachys chloroleuca]